MATRPDIAAVRHKGESDRTPARSKPAEVEDDSFRPRCLSVDLEVGREDGRIHAVGAVRADTGQRLLRSGDRLAAALTRLDELADGADFVLGHNLIAFDLRYLEAAKPGLRLLKLPRVDTLRLSPLAFPRNPYHHLVKHYQDGGLRRGRVNDPELDARLAQDVFRDQRRALREAEPDLLTAWHWLTKETDLGADIVTSRPGRCWISPSSPLLPRCGPSGTLPSRIAWNVAESTGPESLSASAPLPA